MGFILFSGYLILLTWLVTKTPFLKKLPIPVWALVGLFLIKVGAGMYYGWFFTHVPNYKVQADTWRMYYESLTETNWLKNDPAGFISDFFRPRYQHSQGGIFSTSHSYWNDIKSVLVVKLMAVCNLLSGSRYYVNLIFFEYLSFFGPVALSRLFITHFPKKKWYIIAGAFLFPSTLLWCSGFHKEGLLLTSLAMATWLVHQCLLKGKYLLHNILFIIFHLLIVFLLRNYMAAFFVLWCIPWVAAHYTPKYKRAAFGVTLLLACAMFFLTSYIKSLPDLPETLAMRQKEFLKISGESLIQPQPLQKGLTGYAAALPRAVINGFIQPLPFNIKKASYIPAAAEIVVFVLLLINAFYQLSIKKTKLSDSPALHKDVNALLLFCILFGAAAFLLIGFTIPYLGAVVRYKAVAWPFIVLPLVLFIPTLKPGIKKKYM